MSQPEAEPNPDPVAAPPVVKGDSTASTDATSATAEIGNNTVSAPSITTQADAESTSGMPRVPPSDAFKEPDGSEHDKGGVELASGKADSNDIDRVTTTSLITTKRPTFVAGILFVVGVAVALWGFSILRSDQQFAWLPDWLQTALNQANLDNVNAVFVGGTLMLFGAGLAALATRRTLADTLDSLMLPLPRLRRDIPALVSIGGAVVCTGLLYIHLSQKQYTHWDIAIFFASLVLLGFAIHRLDQPPHHSTLRWVRFDWLLMTGLTALVGVVNSVDLTSWKFAWIGDEGAFFAGARGIILTEPWNFFNLHFVYDAFPTLDSLMQAAVMKLLGVNVVGWRLSEVLVTMLASALMYALATILFGRLAGVAAALVLGSSNYIIAFGRIGYDNTHAILYPTLALLLLVLAWRTQRAIFVYGVGIALGFCLYTFQAAILIWPLFALILLIIFIRRPSWILAGAGVLMLLGFALVVIPALLTTPLYQIITEAIRDSRKGQSAIDPGLTFLVGLAQSVVSFWQRVIANHNVGGPLLDPISSMLLTLGFTTALLRLNKRAERLALIWFGGSLLLVAATSYRAIPALTRLLVVIPGAALLAGLGAVATEQALRQHLRLPRPLATGLLLIALALLPLFNQYQLLVDSPKYTGTNSEDMLMKALEEHPMQVVVQVGSQPIINSDYLQVGVMLRAYPWYQDYYRYVTTDELPTMTYSATELPPVYVVDQPDAAITPTVQAILPTNYRATLDTGPRGDYQMWIFNTDNSQTHPSTTAPALTSPRQVAEVHLQSSPSSKLASPDSLAVDSQGNIYVASRAEGVIRKYDATGKLEQTWGNTASSVAMFQDLSALAVGRDGTVYALDMARQRILRFSSDGHDEGILTSAVVSGTSGLRATPFGDLLLINPNEAGIRWVQPTGEIHTIIGNNAPNCQYQFKTASDVQANAVNDLFVLDGSDGHIERLSWWWCIINNDVSYKKTWSVGNNPTAMDGRIALDKYGRLFVTIPASSEIVVYDSNGQQLARWAQPNNEAPEDIVVDADDNIYVSYPVSATVRKFQLTP